MSFRVRVEGLRELDRSADRAASEIPREVERARSSTTRDIASRTQRGVPVLTGRARSSVRVNAQGVEAGRGVIYYPWLEFGGRVGRNHSVYRAIVPGGRYLYPTATGAEAEMAREIDRGLAGAFRRVGF